MSIYAIDEAFVPEAASLAAKAYACERRHVPCLPEGDHTRILTDRISRLFRLGTGVIYCDGGRVTGFMAGYPVDSFFGKSNGVYCPAYGHRAWSPEVYVHLYRAAADGWLRAGLFTHAVTLYAHDRCLSEYFFAQGFGMRCVDAMRFTAPVPAAGCAGVGCVKITYENCVMLRDIHRKADFQFCESPVFMPDKAMEREEDPASFIQSGGHEWAALREGRPVGFMRVSRECEHFAAGHASVMNVGGTYVLPEERGRGIGTLLLGAATGWMAEQGYARCGVDYESINPYAQAFWPRYFMPYTGSVVRRVDERAAGYLPPAEPETEVYPVPRCREQRDPAIPRE